MIRKSQRIQPLGPTAQVLAEIAPSCRTGAEAARQLKQLGLGVSRERVRQLALKLSITRWRRGPVRARSQCQQCGMPVDGPEHRLCRSCWCWQVRAQASIKRRRRRLPALAGSG